MGSRIGRIEEATMAGCGDCCAAAQASNDRRWRRALWIALGINGAMFAGEMVVGLAANSQALPHDALDFFGDADNYAIRPVFAGLELRLEQRRVGQVTLREVLGGYCTFINNIT